MPSPNNELTLRQALALGALQGPTELLPVSSSAHTAALAWLLGWNYDQLDPELRKSFEVALHAGGTLALLLRGRNALRAQLRLLDGRRRRVMLASAVAPALAGVGFRGVIERRLGTPKTTATALLAGAALMAAADRFPEERSAASAELRDGIWLGLAQAAALAPGVSRAGATLSAARILRFRSADARALSEQVALPVLLGAAVLEAIGLRRRRLDPLTAARFMAGGLAAFASTLVLARELGRASSGHRLLPYAVYRTAVAGLILIRLRRS